MFFSVYLSSYRLNNHTVLYSDSTPLNCSVVVSNGLRCMSEGADASHFNIILRNLILRTKE